MQNVEDFQAYPVECHRASFRPKMAASNVSVRAGPNFS
ncbi:hypothetical protein RV134_350527 [Roseovarius sp. EC-HK134]|nr:hypothetical protein RV134_350527 [Roseovarius sp. EC-HK134]